MASGAPASLASAAVAPYTELAMTLTEPAFPKVAAHLAEGAPASLGSTTTATYTELSTPLKEPASTGVDASSLAREPASLTSVTMAHSTELLVDATAKILEEKASTYKAAEDENAAKLTE